MIYRKVKSLPGQLSNCEICDKRFTVTPYSKAGPAGALLCSTCSKRVVVEGGNSKFKIRGPNKRGRRQKSSNILDGIVHHGALSLLDMCIKVRYKLRATLKVMDDWLTSPTEGGRQY
jgi:DNA repair protein RAD7